MRLLFITLLILISQYGLCQSSIKSKLLTDIAASRKDLNSSQRAWFCKDDNTFDTRDTLVFYNNVNYQNDYKKESDCQYFSWTFTSNKTFRQNSYFVCQEPPLIYGEVTGKEVHYFKFIASRGVLILQVANYQNHLNLFKVSRIEGTDLMFGNKYPIMMLVRIKSNKL